ncbi:diguanylate cyclase [Roseibium sp. RKSG952]|uniref:diguanylate cyclase domain-containing protein n=1 Tax=Roseibium sp. RKSG952 TaxID=2529384 RepID=UPI0018AD13C8|nr:diguanylate cyclase [Roseibium sp. RKSG952]
MAQSETSVVAGGERPDPITDDTVQALLESSPYAVLGLDEQLRVGYASPAITSLLGWAPEDVCRCGLTLLAPQQDASFLDWLNTFKLRHSPIRGRNRLLSKSEGLIWVDVTLKHLAAAGAGSCAFGLYLQDAAGLVDLEEALIGLSPKDELTGLATAGSFRENLPREWAMARRGKTPLSLLLIEVARPDNPTGWERLSSQHALAIARVIRTVARRPSDLAVRLIENRFAVLLPNTPEAAALAIAQKISKALEAPAPGSGGTSGRSGFCTYIGAVTALFSGPSSGEDPLALPEAAKLALVKARTGSPTMIETGRLA